MMRLLELESGPALRVCALELDGRCASLEFVRGLPVRAQQGIFATFALLAKCGWRLRNETRFKHLREDVYEIKEYSSNVRLFCFLHAGRLVVCTHGTRKPGGRGRYAREIEKVLRLHRMAEEQAVI
ncbi:MAG TPA: hypothetical protein ENN51_02410 [candidate division WOR-3 bacterium]|uniref:Type II toxin-antitoxin system RelE/ParE family toxin n=1 Tax=candidate division WOR-3 bacterium TaxID=2052148 RepID=A0A7V0XEZ9_UNCW3|nr:hypothetical protein [candidate division WOR-3 bacterium]